jgi:hypothetical protein
MRLLARPIHTLLGAGMLCAAAGPASAGDLPARLQYSYYLEGKRVGGSDIRITRSKDALVFDSRTRLTLAPGAIDVTCRTVADPATFAIRRFSLEGDRFGVPVATEVEMRGDSAVGWTRYQETRTPRRIGREGGFMIMEDWTMELDLLIALRQVPSTRVADTYHVLSGNSLSPNDMLAGYTGEVLVESDTRSLVARRLEFFMQGGSAFEIRVDPDSTVPIYARAPMVRAEVFLDSFFGENPEPYFSPPAAAPGDR